MLLYLVVTGPYRFYRIIVLQRMHKVFQGPTVNCREEASYEYFQFRRSVLATCTCKRSLSAEWRVLRDAL